MRSDLCDVPEWLNVSRETTDRMKFFHALVLKWGKAINLVARTGQAEIWQRHVLDSAQLIQFIPDSARELCDLGSGGGFPGIVIAILAQEVLPNLNVTLVESDKRKAVFLGQAIRELQIKSTVKMCRIEQLPQQSADVISARALSPLVELLPFAARHLRLGGVAIFPKGASAANEVEEARRAWTFQLDAQSSRTSADAKILILKDIAHV
jgi:16S rRNA (guanine527-N7)-methyltransferase